MAGVHTFLILHNDEHSARISKLFEQTLMQTKPCLMLHCEMDVFTSKKSTSPSSIIYSFSSKVKLPVPYKFNGRLDVRLHAHLGLALGVDTGKVHTSTALLSGLPTGEDSGWAAEVADTRQITTRSVPTAYTPYGPRVLNPITGIQRILTGRHRSRIPKDLTGRTAAFVCTDQHISVKPILILHPVPSS
jgi:hypothetical protein